MDMSVAYKISANVSGQQAVDALKTSFEKLGSAANDVSKGALGMANNFGSLSNPIGMVTSQLGKFAGVLGIAGAVAGLTSIVKSAIDAGDELNKMAQKTGVSVEALSTFKLAAKLSDLELGDLAKSLVKFDVSTAKAQNGNKELAAAFKVLGFSMSELSKMNTEERMLKTSDAFAKMADGANKTALAVTIFGKAGAGMLPFLNMGSEEMEKLGVKMSSEFAARAETFNDSITIMHEKMKVFTSSAVGSLLPTLQEIMNGFLKTAGTKPEMVDFFDVVGEAARLLAMAIKTVWSALSQLGDAVITTLKVAKSAVTGDFAAIDTLNDDFEKRTKDRANRMIEFNKSMLKNSLLFGDGSVDEIKKRQQADTDIKLRKGGTTPDISGLNTAAADLFTNEMSSLGREAAKLKFESANVKEFQDRITSAKEAQIKFDIEQGKLKDLSAGQKSQLLETARAVDKYAASLKQELGGLEFEKATKMIDAETRSMSENQLVKKQTLALQDLENKGIKEGTELYERLKTSRFEALQKNYDESRSFSVGMKTAMTDYADMATNAAAQVKNAFTNAFRGAEDALINFAMTGKLTVTDLANSIIKDLIRIALQKSITGPLSSALSSAFGGFSFGGGTPATVHDFSTPLASANGNVFNGGSLQAFATGGIVGSPTMFPMANGTGLMGEAGPEAIMPLKRGSDGKLGVAGGGGSTNITVNVSTEGGTSVSGSSNDSGRLGQAIAVAVRQELITQKRPGGLLSAV